MRRHGGHIRFTTEEGEGTTFFVYLPSAGPARAGSSRGVSRRGAGQRVLLMDDERMILDVAGEMLSYMGFSVATAASGEEALEVYRRAQREGRPFSLVILDLTVPGGMGGEETIQRLRRMDPSVRAVVSSGYSNNPVMANHRRWGFNGVVAKPYRIEQLQAVVEEVLQEH